jgi:hypothetical protein
MLPSCRWFAAIIALALSVHVNAQQQPPPPPPPAGAQRFTDATTKLIAAINADDQPAIQQMFNEAMQKALPAEKTGPFFRGLLSAKGKLQAAGAPEVSGPAAKVRVTAERGDWRFEIALDPSDKIAGLLVLPGDDKPGRKEAPPATDGVPANEPKYFELRRSKDRLTQQIAERYYNLVKLQEWSSDKGTKIKAKYVSHAADLTSVKIAVVKGYGAERTEKEVTVPVERLSKTCQSRVKQIATIQKKLDELIAGGASGEPGQAQPSGDPGLPMSDERGAEPRRRRPPSQRSPATADREEREGRTPAVADASIADDGEVDPLGFGELPANPAPATAGPGITPLATLVAGAPPADADPSQAKKAEPKDKDAWRTDYEAFRASLKVDASRAVPRVNWDVVPGLKEAVDEVQKWEDFGSVGEEEYRKIAEKFNAVGEFSWEATLTDADVSAGDWTERLNLPPLPEPLTIGFVLDTERDPGNWQSLKVGDKVRFVGRFVDIEMGSDLVVAIRFTNDGPAADGATRSDESPRSDR